MKKITRCPHCDSIWQINIDRFPETNECPFCHEKIKEEESFSYELKKIIRIYGEEILLNPYKFYSLIFHPDN